MIFHCSRWSHGWRESGMDSWWVVARLQICMWDWRYCCGHLWKIWSAILSYYIHPTPTPASTLQGKLSTLISYLPLNQIRAKESQARSPVLRHWPTFISTLNSFGLSVWICWLGQLWLFSSCGHSQEVVLRKVVGAAPENTTNTVVEFNHSLTIAKIP